MKMEKGIFLFPAYFMDFAFGNIVTTPSFQFHPIVPVSVGSNSRLQLTIIENFFIHNEFQ
jgi:hypothetical protein